MKIKGTLALVTGGAGGIGKAVAAGLLRRGARVALWDLDPAALEKVKSELSPSGEVFVQALDLRDRAAIARSAAELRAKLGDVDILDANAGVVFGGDFLTMSEDRLAATIDVNVNAVMWCTREFLPGMLRRGQGHLVFMSSASGLLGVPGLAAYAASKHAVIGLAESLRLELKRSGQRGVGLTIVCPSFVSSGMFAGAKPPLLAPWLAPEDVAARVVAAIESNRRYVRAPWLVELIPLVKGFAGTRVLDALGGLLGMDRAMDTFAGHSAPIVSSTSKSAASTDDSGSSR